MNAIIITGGDIDLSLLESYISQNRYATVISVDAAVKKLEEINKMPNVMVGDFDTLTDESRLEHYADLGVEIVRHNPVKDFSDSELAIDWAYKRNISEIVVFGALGRRFDHTFANILLLQKYKKLGVDITIIDRFNRIYVKSNPFILEKRSVWGKYISFFAIREKVLIESLTGVAYPVENKYLDNIESPSLFISNEIVEDYMSVIFNGEILVVESRD
jgi:thiamine diphosphokinase